MAPSLDADFTNWDDATHVIENTAIRELSLEKAARYFTDWRHEEQDFYKPLVLLSYAADRKLFGDGPAGFHRTNLILHVLNTVLVFAFVFGLGETAFAAFLVAALFGAHPVHVESVAWIAQRKDLLYSLFYLLALVAYADYVRRGSARHYAAALFFFILSLLSKPMAVTLGVVLFLVDYRQGRAWGKRVLAEKAPFLALGLGFGVLTIATAASRLHGAPFLHFPENVLTMSDALLWHLRALFFPAELSAFYPMPARTGHVFGVFSPAILLLPAAMLFVFRRSRRALFGALFFLVTIAPALRMAPSAFFAADHYLYIPALGLFYAAAIGAERLAARLSLPPRRAAWFLVLAVIAALGFWARERCSAWQDSESLWSDVLRKSPAGSWSEAQAWSGLASHYFGKGESVRALEAYDRAIALSGRDAKLRRLAPAAFYNRANLKSRLGRREEAVADFDRAAEELEKDRASDARSAGEETARSDRAYAKMGAKIFSDRGYEHAALGRDEEALADYDAALALEPGLKDAIAGRGRVFDRRGEYPAAQAEYLRALAIDPDFKAARDYLRLSRACQRLLPELSRVIGEGTAEEKGRAYFSRGVLYARLDMRARALEDLGRAAVAAPSREIFLNRGNVLLAAGRDEEALADFDRVIAMDEKDHEAWFFRAEALGRLGRPAEAEAARSRFRRAVAAAAGK